ncbi:MAG: hypothetical protein V8T62_00715 [Oscillospiraceae bacterium]
MLEMPLTDPQEKEILKNAGLPVRYRDHLQLIAWNLYQKALSGDMAAIRELRGILEEGEAAKRKNRKAEACWPDTPPVVLLMMCGELQEKSRTKPRPEEQTETGVSLRRLIASAYRASPENIGAGRGICAERRAGVGKIQLRVGGVVADAAAASQHACGGFSRRVGKHAALVGIYPAAVGGGRVGN